MDEQFVHQIPELLPARRDPPPALAGELLLRRPPARRAPATSCSSRWRTTRSARSWTRCRWDGSAASSVIGLHPAAVRRRPAHHRRRRGARVEVVRPCEEIRLWADPEQCARSASTSPSGPAPSRTGCGGARCAPATTLVWDQSHILQSGTYDGHLHRRRHDPRGRRLDRPARPLVGHPRPRPLPAVAVVPDPARRRASSACGTGSCRTARRVYTDGCWAATDGSDPVPLVGFEHDVEWVGADGAAVGYGEHGETVVGLARPVRVHARGRPPDRRRRRGHLRPPLRAVPPRRPEPDARPHRRRARGHARSTRSPAPATTATSRTRSCTGTLPS